MLSSCFVYPTTLNLGWSHDVLRKVEQSARKTSSEIVCVCVTLAMLYFSLCSSYLYILKMNDQQATLRKKKT